MEQFLRVMPHISSETEIVILSLFQCEFTLKDGHLIKPRKDLDFNGMLAMVQEIENRVARLAPQAYIFWTIPVVRKFRVPDEIVSVEEKKEMAARLREWIQILRSNGHYIMDLAKTYQTGENREPYSHRYTQDGIHPTHQGGLKFFQNFRRQIITIGILDKIVRNRRNTTTVVTYE